MKQDYKNNRNISCEPCRSQHVCSADGPVDRYPILIEEADNALITPLGLRISMGGDDHLPSDGWHARLPFENNIKIRRASQTVRRYALVRRDIVPRASHVNATKSSEPLGTSGSAVRIVTNIPNGFGNCNRRLTEIVNEVITFTSEFTEPGIHRAMRWIFTVKCQLKSLTRAQLFSEGLTAAAATPPAPARSAAVGAARAARAGRSRRRPARRPPVHENTPSARTRRSTLDTFSYSPYCANRDATAESSSFRVIVECVGRSKSAPGYKSEASPPVKALRPPRPTRGSARRARARPIVRFCIDSLNGIAKLFSIRRHKDAPQNENRCTTVDSLGAGAEVVGCPISGERPTDNTVTSRGALGASGVARSRH
ncbi:hypothetical protein EVAR_102427_1 [Eumeta japonica]|uniref:Uncharacterized protein n=1 Tax=Eumeta variegata TaxID=151549 RepID=A0A4C1Z1L4_EUMVA|nr:hypothetical protein EVAR_102427_1 [Eumeta japonica]